MVEGGVEWDEFHLQAELAHCPPGIRAKMMAIDQELAATRATLAEIRDAFAEYQRHHQGSR